jgi:peroxiredoxin
VKKLFFKGSCGPVIISLIIAFFLSSCTKREDEGIKFESPEINTLAPDFTLSDINGKQVTLSAYRGRIVLIEFWVTWCPPCRDSIAELAPVYEKYKDKGFAILAISMDKGQDVEERLTAFAKEYSMSYPVLLGDKNIAFNYGVNGLPTSFLLNKEGKIEDYYIGYQPYYMGEISRKIEALL